MSDDPLVSPEENASINYAALLEAGLMSASEFAANYVQGMVAFVTLPLLPVLILSRPYQGPPERWPFRAARLAEDDRI
jgi:hypothetical protein